MKAKIATFCLLITFIANTFAQSGEGNNWIFGANARVSWDCSSVTPVAFSGSPLSTNEGVATISDPNCNLLFFTDGISVWDANMIQMPNGFGLTGDASSTQSAVIIPKPMDPNTYYVFTVDDNLGSDGLAYSRVDMTANGGLGDIDPLEKNVPITNPAPEKIAAVNHSNGSDIWVIVHEWGNAIFRSYLVTSAPIDVNIYVSINIGTPHAGSSAKSRGYMKASPSGTKVVLGIEGMGIYELFDFDNTTGILSNPITMPGFPDAYGCEFSPDEHYLYAVNRWDNEVHQWDLYELPNATNFLNSHETVGWLGPQSYGDGGAVQLAPDGKIYCARDDVSWLACIEDPLLGGVAANLVIDAVFLDVPSTPTIEECDEGLPSFIISFIASNDPPWIMSSCYIDTTYFYFGIINADSVFWNFNYPSTDPIWHNTTDINPWYVFDPGTYIIQCISYNGNVSDTVMDTLTVVYIPWANLGPSPTVLCTNEIIEYDLSYNEGCTFLWTAYLGSYTYTDTLPTFLIDTPGNYSVQITNECGTIVESIMVEYNEIEPNLDTNISGICETNPITLDATVVNNYGTPTYIWNTGETTDSIVALFSGTFEVTIDVANCSESTSIEVEYDISLSPNIGADTTICPGDSVILDAGNAGATYFWSNGESTQEITIFDAGTYAVIVTNACGSFPDFMIIEFHELNINLGGDIVVCEGQSTTIDATDTTAVSYLWSTGDNTATISTTIAGLYAVTIENHCGAIDTDSAMVYVLSTSIELGADTSICQGSTLLLDVGVPGLTYIWSTSETMQAIEVTEAGMYSVTVTDPICGDAIGNIIVSVDPVPTIELGFDTLEIEFGTTGIFDAGSGYSSYLWSNGETTQSIEISEEGLYSVIVTNEFGCSAYDEAYLKVGPNSIEENSLENSISIFPNPVKEKLFINSEIAEIEKVDIYNSIGKLIYSERNKSKNIELDVSKYPMGVYFIRVDLQNGNIIFKPVFFLMNQNISYI